MVESSPEVPLTDAPPSDRAAGVTFADIDRARERIASLVPPTPCPKSGPLSQIAGGEVYLKLENLQLTGSFKERGAVNKLLQLSADERARGVIAASAGNHAQAVAYHAGRLGIPAVICMPETSPLIKVSSTRDFGARVVLQGANYDEAYEEARRIQEREGQVFLHAFDDDAVIAGQGTVALEMIEQVAGIDVVYVALGGGGLASGIATVLAARSPKTKIVGVEAKPFARLLPSLEEGRPVTAAPATTLADGIACRTLGARPFPILKRLVHDAVAVDDEEIASAILLLLEREKTVAEGAGAAPLAGMLKQGSLSGRRAVLVLSGGNIDVNMIARIIERGLVKDGRLVRLVLKIPDRPGSLARLLTVVAQTRANVMEISHNRMPGRSALGETGVDLTLETRGPEHIAEIRGALAAHGWQAREER